MDASVYVEFIKVLGSLSSITSASLAARKAYLDSNLNKRDGSNDDLNVPFPSEVRRQILQQPPTNSVPRPADVLRLEIISDDILEVAMTRLKAARSRYANVITYGRINDIEDEYALTRREICFVLSLILRNNNDNFPEGGELARTWQEFRCTALYPEFGIRNF